MEKQAVLEAVFWEVLGLLGGKLKVQNYCMMTHSCNPNTLKTGAEGMAQVQGQPGLNSEI